MGLTDSEVPTDDKSGDRRREAFVIPSEKRVFLRSGGSSDLLRRTLLTPEGKVFLVSVIYTTDLGMGMGTRVTGSTNGLLRAVPQPSPQSYRVRQRASLCKTAVTGLGSGRHVRPLSPSLRRRSLRTVPEPVPKR